MKYIMFSLLMIVAGCDTPTRSRFPTSIANGNNQTAPGFDFTSGGSTAGATTGSTTGGAPANLGPGFETCSLAKTNTTADLGGIGICQSTADETKIKFITSLENLSSRTCFIPTYKDQGGNSTYLGEPQCTITQAERVYTGTLVKNRTNIGTFPITGVMIMKEALLPEYFACMNEVARFVQVNCPGPYQNQNCLNAAMASRNQICNNFKLKYPNNYLDLFI